MIILGVNAYHADSSACILIDGKLIAAVEEERFLRVKHWAGFPRQAMRYCLQEAGVGIEEIDRVARIFRIVSVATETDTSAQEELNPNEVIQNLCKIFLEPLFTQHQVSVQTQLDPGMPNITRTPCSYSEAMSKSAPVIEALSKIPPVVRQLL